MGERAEETRLYARATGRRGAHVSRSAMVRAARGYSVVYFVQAATGRGLIKIGQTGDVVRRLSEMQKHCPIDLRLVHWFHGGRAEERALHERFALLRRRGEWFEPHESLRRFIAGEEP